MSQKIRVEHPRRHRVDSQPDHEDTNIVAPAQFEVLQYDVVPQIVNALLNNNNIAPGANIAWNKINKTGSLLNDLGDVNAPGPAAYQVVHRNAANNAWIAALLNNNHIAAGAAIAWNKLDKAGSILDDIGDVVAPAPASGDSIFRDAANQWVNRPLINYSSTANNAIVNIAAGGTNVCTINFTVNHASNPVQIISQATIGLDGPYAEFAIDDGGVILQMNGVDCVARTDTVGQVARTSASVHWMGILSAGAHAISLKGWAVAGAPNVQIGHAQLLITEFRMYG